MRIGNSDMKNGRNDGVIHTVWLPRLGGALPERLRMDHTLESVSNALTTMLSPGPLLCQPCDVSVHATVWPNLPIKRMMLASKFQIPRQQLLNKWEYHSGSHLLAWHQPRHWSAILFVSFEYITGFHMSLVILANHNAATEAYVQIYGISAVTLRRNHGSLQSLWIIKAQQIVWVCSNQNRIITRPPIWTRQHALNENGSACA